MKKDNFFHPTTYYTGLPQPNQQLHNHFGHPFPKNNLFPRDYNFIEQPVTLNFNGIDRQQVRQSFEPNHGQSTSISNLRHQISNLKNEFTKLIQKEIPNNQIETKMKPQFYGSQISQGYLQRKQSQNTNYQVPNQINHLPDRQSSDIFKNQFQQSQVNFKSKTLQYLQEKNYHEKMDIQNRKTCISRAQDLSLSKIPKRLSHYSQKKSELQYKNIPEQFGSNENKIQELEVEILKLGEMKCKAEEENQYLKKHLLKKQSEYLDKTDCLKNEIEKLKISNEQLSISLSLKNSLMEKLQKELQKCKKELLIANQKGLKLNKQYAEYKEEIQKIHMVSIEEMRTKCAEIQKSKIILFQEIQQKDSLIKNLSLQMERIENELKNEKADSHSKISDSTSEQSLKLKNLQQQNNELKKRVQSYKKSLQQLNNSSNITRDKQLLLKEQNKILQQQLKIKQNLITSLYGDIRILDSQIRHSNQTKNQLNQANKLIHELTSNIIDGDLEKLNLKYQINQ